MQGARNFSSNFNALRFMRSLINAVPRYFRAKSIFRNQTFQMFLFSAANVRAKFNERKLAAYGPTTEMIGAVGLPAPSLAFAVAVVVELGGGLLLIAGFQARLVAIALALFCLATAASFHGNFADQNQMIHFLKNIMIAGGLLQIAGFGAGVISVDDRLSKGHEAIANAAGAR